jgi:hypothetical protein
MKKRTQNKHKNNKNKKKNIMNKHKNKKNKDKDNIMHRMEK